MNQGFLSHALMTHVLIQNEVKKSGEIALTYAIKSHTTHTALSYRLIM